VGVGSNVSVGNTVCGVAVAGGAVVGVSVGADVGVGTLASGFSANIEIPIQ
jgi:hypothetical protein